VHALDQVLEAVRQQHELVCAQIAHAARSQLTNDLNQVVRRFRNYRDESEWISALLDGVSLFVDQAAVFLLESDTFKLRAQTNLNIPPDLAIRLGDAAAFRSAVETHDPVIALRTPSEVTQALAGSDASDRCHVIPIMNSGRAVAILFASDHTHFDVNALELIAGIASTVLERQSNIALHAQIAAAPKLPSPEVLKKEEPKGAGLHLDQVSKATLPAWADLDEEQRALHIRAQRFSRVAVAEMQLSKPQGCRAGREQGNLYLFLKPEIEKARETYRKQFLTIPSMVDYLHVELVNTAAEGDEMKLGAEYPGQLV
jgi:hypothetical protein